jgi:hypothetical protein
MNIWESSKYLAQTVMSKNDGVGVWTVELVEEEERKWQTPSKIFRNVE